MTSWYEEIAGSLRDLKDRQSAIDFLDNALPIVWHRAYLNAPGGAADVVVIPFGDESRVQHFARIYSIMLPLKIATPIAESSRYGGPPLHGQPALEITRAWPVSSEVAGRASIEDMIVATSSLIQWEAASISISFPKACR